MEIDYKAKKFFEDGYYKCEEDMKEKYTLELWMGLYKNGVYNIPLYKLNKVKEKNVRELLKDEPNLDNLFSFYPRMENSAKYIFITHFLK